MVRWPFADVRATLPTLAVARRAAAALASTSAAAATPASAIAPAAAAAAATTAVEASQTHSVVRWPFVDVRATLLTLAVARRAAAALASASAAAATTAVEASQTHSVVRWPFVDVRATLPTLVVARRAAPASAIASDRDPALSVQHPFRHRGFRHLDFRAKVGTCALHSFRVVMPITRSADGRNEGSLSPDPDVTTHIGLVGAPFERAPPTPSPGRFLRVAEP